MASEKGACNPAWNKSGSEKSDYKPRKTGGFRDWLKRRTAVTEKRTWFGKLFFRAIVAAAPLTKWRPTDKIMKHVAMMGDGHHTAGFSIPSRVDVNIDLSKQAQGRTVHPPIELIRKTLEEAQYRAIMKECLCRVTFKCDDYPRDLGCLFVGKAAQSCVKSGIAKEATLEECNAHVDRAIALGLAPSAYWVEVEEFVWGFKNEDIPHFMEFCFCCDCCCAAVQFHQRAGGELQKVLQQNVGWQCQVITESCTGCEACVPKCPFGYLGKDSRGVMQVDSACIGCGRCLDACSSKALHVVQTGETKEKLTDYFANLHLKL